MGFIGTLLVLLGCAAPRLEDSEKRRWEESVAPVLVGLPVKGAGPNVLRSFLLADLAARYGLATGKR